MSQAAVRLPLIARYYCRFLDEGDVAGFIQAVSEAYSLATLHRLAMTGGRIGRRGAVLAVTLIGGPESVSIVGRALHDLDRGVRLIAEDGIQAMWNRAGSFEHCQQLQRVTRLNASGRHVEAIDGADAILVEHPTFGEVWFQRGEAQLAQGRWFEAIADCGRALECETFHFPAAFNLAQAYLELGDLATSIDCLQRALHIYPHWELARVRMTRLERELREQTDR